MTQIRNIQLKTEKEINKITVAQRQLETAIELFFEGKDMVSIHTLAAAASQVLHDLCQKKGIEPAYQQMVVNPNAETFRAGREHRNFFKHADKEEQENAIINLFESAYNEVVIWQAMQDYESLMHDYTPTMSAFYQWFIVRFPDSLDALPSGKILKAQVQKCSTTLFQNADEEDTRKIGLITLRLKQLREDEILDLVAELNTKLSIDIPSCFASLRFAAAIA